MKEHDSFLRNDEPSLERMCNHRRGCSVFQNGDCSCQRGAYSIAEVQDLENQLLQTGDARGPTTYRIIKPAMSMGLDNFRRVFASTTASSSLDDATSVGSEAPGVSRGTGNQLFGANGKLSSTFAYWGHVLKGALGLIPRLYALIQDLWQRLSAQMARADAAEARADSAEARADSTEALADSAEARAGSAEVRADSAARLSLNSVELAASAARRAREKEIQDKHSVVPVSPTGTTGSFPRMDSTGRT